MDKILNSYITPMTIPEDLIMDEVCKIAIERLANHAHRSWSGWMKYLFAKSFHQDDGTIVIPKELVDRWSRQAHTEYKDLSEEEKESDREEARKALRFLNDGQ